MRTKTLLLTAALSAVITASAFAADAVYSVNVVGYVTKHVPVGWSMWVNPLMSQDARVSAIMPNATGGTQLFKYNGVGYNVEIFDDADMVWIPGTNTLAPGQGFWINTPAAFDVTFVGTVIEGTDSNLSLRQGWNLTGSMVPQDGTLDTMYADAVGGNQIFKYTNNGAGGGVYATAIFDDADLVWIPPAFPLAPAEGFWLNASTAGQTWVRNFTVPRTP